jgi:AcrR family transcriptional regulator
MARPAHRPSRRAHILDASLDLFVEHGPMAVTVADIAERAGMTAAAIYYHFPSKAEVLLELVEEIGDRLVEIVGGAGDAVDVEAWLASRYDELARWQHRAPGELALYLDASVGVSTAAEGVRRRQHREMLGAAAVVVARGRRDLDQVEVHIVALGLVTLLLQGFGARQPAGREQVVAIGAQLQATAPLAPRRLRR